MPCFGNKSKAENFGKRYITFEKSFMITIFKEFWAKARFNEYPLTPDLSPGLPDNELHTDFSP